MKLIVMQLLLYQLHDDHSGSKGENKRGNGDDSSLVILQARLCCFKYMTTENRYGKQDKNLKGLNTYPRILFLNKLPSQSIPKNEPIRKMKYQQNRFEVAWTSGSSDTWPRNQDKQHARRTDEQPVSQRKASTKGGIQQMATRRVSDGKRRLVHDI